LAPFKIAWIFFRVGAMNELQYRVNFFVQLLQSLIALGTGLVGLWLVFSHTSSLDGWTPSELLALMGVYTLMGGLINTVIQPNMERLMGEVQDGTLDYALTKPEDAQLLVSVREVRIWQAVDVITGLIVTAIALSRLQAHLGIGQALSFLLVLVMGGVMIYCFWLILTSAAFWVVRMDEIVNLFQGVYAAGRYPVGIYPNWLRLGLTFLVPIAFAVTVPAEALTGRLTPQTVLGTAALTILLLLLTRWIWRLGLRRYSGASA
jgi:ABC-2 type transport system permease protein